MSASHERAQRVEWQCPAKINLHLRVGPCRADGFHSLRSWMTTVGLFDTLTIEPAALEGGAPAEPPFDLRSDSRQMAGAARMEPPDAGLNSIFSLRCDVPDLPCDQRNLVVRIARAFAEHVAMAATVTPVTASLAKRIPMGAGLGGGSSDAATTLRALNRLWRANCAADDLSAFAARFGSDIPFFLHGPSSACSGRGEVVRPNAPPRPRWAMLVLPAVHMPTAEVYRRFDEMGLGREQDVADEPYWAEWATLDARDLLPRLVNDLEPPAFAIRPELGALQATLEEKLGRPVRMSGSGSSLFTLFDGQEEAEKDRSAASTAGARVEVVAIAPPDHAGA